LQVDNGRFHTSKKLLIPENIILLFQPSYCPELNPIERLWMDLYPHGDGHKLKKEKIIKNPIDIDLYNWMNEESRQGKPIKIRRMKVASKIARIWYNELVNEIRQ
jgi:hypothetical protein